MLNEPGNELDCLVAEKIMGLESRGWKTPSYSTNINDALAIIEEMSEHGFKIVMANSSIGGIEKAGDQPWAFFGLAQEKVIPVYGIDFPHAICLAALAAIETEKSLIMSSINDETNKYIQKCAELEHYTQEYSITLSNLRSDMASLIQDISPYLILAHLLILEPNWDMEWMREEINKLKDIDVKVLKEKWKIK